MKVKLSVVIITLNEEKNIARCIESVKDIADDIVIIDSFSTDNTQNICEIYNVRFIQHEFEGYIEQKNWAISQALYPHILSLDADEALDETLQKSILKIKDNWQYDGYYMSRLTNYCGKWVHYCGWYPDKKLRLFDSLKGNWTGINPHDKYEIFDGNKSTSFLNGNILHYSYYTIDGHYKQTRKFAKITAQSLFFKNKKSNFINRFLSPVFRFFRDYILLRGILDGKTGFTICRITSFGTYLKYKNLHKLWKSNGRSIGIDNVKKIIISRTDAIGDVILTLPICGILKMYYPDCKIVFLGKTYTESIINHCEHIDEFLNVDILFKLKEKEQVEIFKSLDADTIIHVFPNKKIAKIARIAKIQNRIGTSNRTYHWKNINHFVFFSRKKSNLHESQLNCKLLRPLGVDFEPNLLKMSTFSGFSKNIQPSNFNFTKSTKSIILHPKSNASAREWSLDNFKALIHLFPKANYTFYISGTAKEKEDLADWLLDLPDNVIDVTGKFKLEEFISFISKADFLVAASTGPLHIAAALGIGAIGIFPPMRPIHPGRWQPIGQNAHYLASKIDCNACVGNPNLCVCMDLIKPIDVAQIILKN